MTRLACSAHNCVNYMNGMCSALTIEVDGESAENKQETCCNTFAPRTFVNAIKSAFNTNYLWNNNASTRWSGRCRS